MTASSSVNISPSVDAHKKPRIRTKEWSPFDYCEIFARRINIEDLHAFHCRNVFFSSLELVVARGRFNKFTLLRTNDVNSATRLKCVRVIFSFFFRLKGTAPARLDKHVINSLMDFNSTQKSSPEENVSDKPELFHITHSVHTQKMVFLLFSWRL